VNEAVFTLFNRRTFFFSRKYVVYEWSECKCYCIVGGGRSVQRREVEMSAVSKDGGCPQCPKTGRENVRGEKCSEGNVRHIQYATPSKIVPFTGAVHPFLYFFSFAVLSNKRTHRPRNIGSNRPHLRALSAILSRKNIRSKTRNKTACATSAS